MSSEFRVRSEKLKKIKNSEHRTKILRTIFKRVKDEDEVEH